MTSNQLVAIANVFHANILNVSSTDMIVELTGTPSTLDSFVECCKPYHIVKDFTYGYYGNGKIIAVTKRNTAKGRMMICLH